MMFWIKRLSVLTLIALMSVCIFAADQSIEGVVKDNTGGVIPGVTVILTNVDTGTTRQALTDDNGYFVFNNIRTGNYELKSELEGFQPVKVTGIKVEIGSSKSVPLTMTVSQLTTEVEVKAEAEQVETTTSQLDTVIDEKRITDLPLNGRNPLNLIYLTPGVTGDVTGPSANGSRGRGTNYQMDGIDNNDTAVYGSVVDTNVDATAEFRVITSNPSAEYGRAGGAIIDVISKSGTNEYHGNLFWFHRNDNLDANSWEGNYYDIEKGEYKRNQFGGSFGGPIIKDKLFFFFNTEWMRIRQNAPQTATVPTQAFRDGVTNPDMASIFATYYPLPNTADSSLPGVNGTYAFPFSDPFDSEQYTAKVDYNFSQDHVFSVRYFYNTATDEDARVLPTTDMGRFPYKGHTQSIAINWTWIMSPTFVNDLKVGQNRVVAGWRRPETNPVDLVFSGGFADSFGYFTDFGGPWGYGDQWRNTGTFEIKDTVTWTKGTHNIKFGADIRYMQDNAETNFYIYPSLFFDQYFGYAGADTVSNIQQGLVDYSYQAIYSNGAEFIPGMTDHRGWRSREYDFFIQDDWKIWPNFTLNAGLRYEWKPTPFEVNNILANVGDDFVGNGYHLINQNNFFDPANFSDGDWTTWYYWLYGYPVDDNALWQGTGANIFLASDSQKIFKAPKNNFAPRVGFSWDPWGDGKTALRGGYGISYDRLFDNLLTWNTSQLPFGVTNVYPGVEDGYSGVYPDAAYFGHGTPVPNIELHLPAGATYEMVLYKYQWQQPYIQTWNVSLQRELWPGNIVNLTYAGSSGVHMLVRGNPNAMYHPSTELIQGIMDNFGTSLSVPTVVRYGAVQNSQWSRVHYIDTSAHSTYHGLQASFSHRFQAGLQFSANYSWSKSFDDASESVYTTNGSSPFYGDWWDKKYDRGYSTFDVRHIFNANFIYELPFGPGKWMGGGTEGVLAALIGGWQVNGIFQCASGSPLDYKVARDAIGTGYTNARGASRPNVASYTVEQDGNTVGPTAANFTNWRTDINLATPKGNYYRGFFRAPGFWNVDFSLFKEVKTPWFTSEGAKIQFRAEAFNLFNKTNFGVPSITLSSANLGKTFYAGTKREIQFGLKFIF